MSNPSRVRVAGPLQVCVSGFRDALKRLGYRPNDTRQPPRSPSHADPTIKQPVQLRPRTWCTGGECSRLSDHRVSLTGTCKRP